MLRLSISAWRSIRGLMGVQRLMSCHPIDAVQLTAEAMLAKQLACLRTNSLVAQQESTVCFDCGGRVSEEEEVKLGIQWTRLVAASAAPLDVLSQ
jgi:uncharacterized paraquat-inducible protein A